MPRISNESREAGINATRARYLLNACKKRVNDTFMISNCFSYSPRSDFSDFTAPRPALRKFMTITTADHSIASY